MDLIIYNLAPQIPKIYRSISIMIDEIGASNIKKQCFQSIIAVKKLSTNEEKINLFLHIVPDLTAEIS